MLVCGVLFYLAISKKISNMRGLTSGVIGLSSFSFGIYIFHQMILEVIYYRSNIPYSLGIYILPLVSFCMCYIGSILLTYLFKQVKFGKVLLK